MPTVTVIVPVRDGLTALIECVDALLCQNYPPERFEVLVVDNNSSRFPEPYLPNDPRLTVLSEAALGSYAARNTGIEKAQGEILAFTDADCLPNPDWLRESVAALTDGEDVAMIGGRVEITFVRGAPRSCPEWYEFENGFPQQMFVHDRGFAVTANMTTWRSVFDEVGLFDATLRSGGDAEWGRRVRASGGRQAYAAAAVVQHPARSTWRELTDKHQRTTQGVIDQLPAADRSRPALVRYALSQLRQATADTVRVWRSRSRGKAHRLRYTAARWWVAAVTARVLLVSAVSRRDGRK
jgi:GT2 family glycosyltransferase